MKKLIIIFTLGAFPMAHAACNIAIGLTSNLGKEFELAERILEKKGYAITDNAPLSFFFSAEATVYSSYYNIMLHKTEVIIKEGSVVVYRGNGAEIGRRLNKNPWKKSVTEAFAYLADCSASNL